MLTQAVPRKINHQKSGLDIGGYFVNKRVYRIESKEKRAWFDV
jgi:hypothetical protein